MFVVKPLPSSLHDAVPVMHYGAGKCALSNEACLMSHSCMERVIKPPALYQDNNQSQIRVMIN